MTYPLYIMEYTDTAGAGLSVGKFPSWYSVIQATTSITLRDDTAFIDAYCDDPCWFEINDYNIFIPASQMVFMNVPGGGILTYGNSL